MFQVIRLTQNWWWGGPILYKSFWNSLFNLIVRFRFLWLLIYKAFFFLLHRLYSLLQSKCFVCYFLFLKIPLFHGKLKGFTTTFISNISEARNGWLWLSIHEISHWNIHGLYVLACLLKAIKSFFTWRASLMLQNLMLLLGKNLN